MSNNLSELLLDAGLSEAEAKVYLELLKSPAQNKWELVKRTGLDRNKVYRAFDSLEKLNLAEHGSDGVRSHSLDFLAKHLTCLREKNENLIRRIRAFTPFTGIDDNVEDFEVIMDKGKMLDRYMMMAEVNYDTCFDFGDLEGFVPILGSIDSVFKFRKKRHGQMARNLALCTTDGPFTSCMARTDDQQKFDANIQILKMQFRNKWIIFSDTSDYVMFNDFSGAQNFTSVLIKSQSVADMQRAMFSQFYQLFSR